MNLLFDEELVEAVVLLAADGKRKGAPPLQIRRFHRERERLYSILDPDERNAAFFRLNLSWFREWGIQAVLERIVEGQPLLSRFLDVLAFRKARSEQGAELYVNVDGRRHGVIALRVDRFADDHRLRECLEHELMHLRDMVDPEFGYSPDLSIAGSSPAQQPIVRERYRLMWDIIIDGRLVLAGKPPQAPRERRLAEFERAFSFLPEPKAVFESLWTSARPTHAQLLSLAANPRQLQHAPQPLPGAPCPLCGFPTFEWAEAAALSVPMLATIQREFSHWGPAHGLCRRCIEIYQFSLPSTISA